MARVAFIVSSGRTGTRFLARYFDANYPGVVARHESPPSRLLRLASHAHLQGRLSDDRMRALLARARRRWDRHAGTDLTVESNPFLAGFAELLGDVWEDPIVVHLVRDPRDHARSALNHGTDAGLKGLANRRLPFWYPDVRRLLKLDHRPSGIEQAAGVWAVSNERLLAAAPRYDAYHLLRYEDVFDASHSGLRELCRILGVAYREEGAPVVPGDRINAGRRDELPAWPEWSVRQCRELHAICSPLMEQLGYGTEPLWRQRLSGDG